MHGLLLRGNRRLFNECNRLRQGSCHDDIRNERQEKWGEPVWAKNPRPEFRNNNTITNHSTFQPNSRRVFAIQLGNEGNDGTSWKSCCGKGRQGTKRREEREKGRGIRKKARREKIILSQARSARDILLFRGLMVSFGGKTGHSHYAYQKKYYHS